MVARPNTGYELEKVYNMISPLQLTALGLESKRLAHWPFLVRATANSTRVGL
jgi:hypothetical protein